MLGTLFLWMFWPSFNGSLAPVSFASKHRVVINTVMSLTGSGLVTFALSIALRKKFSMEDIQNATLAGGVAVGSSSDLVISAWGAILIGCIAGTISTFGFARMKDWFYKHFGLHDSCGVQFLHGMPGLLGGIAGSVACANANVGHYGSNLGVIFSQ